MGTILLYHQQSCRWHIQMPTFIANTLVPLIPLTHRSTGALVNQLISLKSKSNSDKSNGSPNPGNCMLPGSGSSGSAGAGNGAGVCPVDEFVHVDGAGVGRPAAKPAPVSIFPCGAVASV